MTRLPRDWVASIALSGSLLVAAGCGQTAAPMSPAAVAVVAAPENNPPPRVFPAPERLAPLPLPQPVASVPAAAVSVQTQYAQVAAPLAATNAGSGPNGPLLGSPTAPPAAYPTTDRLRYAAPAIGPAPAAAPPASAYPSIASAGEPRPGPIALLPQSPPPTAGPSLPPRAPSAVALQIRTMIERANRMAQKAMLFAAKDELVQCLQLVAQASDVQERSSTHAAALTAGLTALKEAADFSPQPGQDARALRVAEIARGHRTPLARQAGDVPPIVAQQQYFSFAQQQLAFAVAGEPAASQALYELGKIQMALATQAADLQSLHGPQAIVFHQAALAVDPRNYLAANELGVLLARYGQLQEARRALVHSVSVQPHVEGWHNLALIHERLGETELARLAENERQLLAQKQPPATAAGAAKVVEWVDPKTFATRSSPEPAWPQPAASNPSAAKSSAASSAATSQRR